MEVIVKILKINPWTGLTKWDKCTDFIGPYLKRNGLHYTGLTEADARRLEKEIGYAEGWLSDTNEKYWATYGLKLGTQEKTLYTDRPMDEQLYLFLKGHKRVADGYSQVTASTDYVLINKDSEAEEKNKFNRVKREAFTEIGKMSIEEMRKCLRLYGYSSTTMSNDLVESKLTEEIERDPGKFLIRWVNNKDKEVQFLIEEAVAKNVIRKNRTQYYYGTDMLGTSLEDTIAYLKEKKNQEIKVAILQEIQGK